MILYTVVASPRFETYGTRCVGLFHSRKEAQAYMEEWVTQELTASGDYSEEEVEEFIALDDIDTGYTNFSVAVLTLTEEGLQPGQVL